MRNNKKAFLKDKLVLELGLDAATRLDRANERTIAGRAEIQLDELNREISLFQKFGPLAVAKAWNTDSLFEVRLSGCVSHEFGHQLGSFLSKTTLSRISSSYNNLLERSGGEHPQAPEKRLQNEQLPHAQLKERAFITGYSRTCVDEYFAESTAAFSFKKSRDSLKEIDPDIHSVLVDIVSCKSDVFQQEFEHSLTEERMKLGDSTNFANDL